VLVITMKPDFSRLFEEEVGQPVRKSVPLRDFSNFRIGGPADYFFEAASVEGLKAALLVARHHSVACYVVGGGFNLLFDDEGFRGLIVKNSVRGADRISLGPALTTFSGTSLDDLVKFAAEQGLAGLEFLAGIPGTVGGAVFGNAGAFGRSIGECLEEAVLMDKEGGEFRAPREYFSFGYRHSELKIKHDVLLSAQFRLEVSDKDTINARIEENLAVRAHKHPPRETAYAGSYFKNPVRPDGAKVAAGYLLEQVGARELSVGGAAVYPGHCNFLINRGNAAARDILALAGELKTRVKERFGIELEEEVIFLPAEFSRP
jgi:UDP-N-acetylmuramate dehydrogenase